MFWDILHNMQCHSAVLLCSAALMSMMQGWRAFDWTISLLFDGFMWANAYWGTVHGSILLYDSNKFKFRIVVFVAFFKALMLPRYFLALICFTMRFQRKEINVASLYKVCHRLFNLMSLHAMLIECNTKIFLIMLILSSLFHRFYDVLNPVCLS